MYIYNTTYKVSLEHQHHFLFFIKDEVFSLLSKQTAILDYKLLELQNVDVQDGNTYCLHIEFNDLPSYNNFKLRKEPLLLEQIYNNYHDGVLFFSSLLKKV